MDAVMEGTAAHSFSATLNRLKEEQKNKVDVVLDTRSHTRLVVPVNDGEIGQVAMEFQSGVPALDGKVFPITQHAHQQMAGRSQVPWKFYDRLKNNHPDVLVQTMNTLWEREPENRLVRTLGNGRSSVRAWLSDRYRVVDNLPFLTAALEEAEKHGAQVMSASVDDTRLYVKLLTPRHVAIDVGDYVQGGAIIRNSEVGDGKIEVSPFTYRLRCKNGAIGMDNYGRIHLGGNLDDGIQSIETQEKESSWIFSAIQDWLRFALGPQNLDKMVEQFKRSKDVRVDSSARLAVANVVRMGGLGKTEAEGVLERYLRADNDTQFSLVNAVTEQAHADGDDYRRQVELEELGGQLLEMEAVQFGRLVSRSLTEKELAGAFSAN